MARLLSLSTTQFLLLHLPLLHAFNSQCATPVKGTTNCPEGCTVLKVFNTHDAEACCAACFAAPLCNAWTLNEGVCRVKAGSSGLNKKVGKSSALSGLRVVTPTPAPPTPAPVPAPAGAKNVIFIAVDDLRPNIGAYGHAFMHTPHMDALAARGLLFQRAYVQYSFCAPSRNSFMTGRRPDATKAWSFMDHFREPEVGGNWTSMPQYFRQHGYQAHSFGKLFHKGLPPSFDARLSWDTVQYSGGCNGDTNGWPVLEPGVTNVECPAATTGCSDKTAVVAGDGNHWCAIDTTKLKAPLEDDVSVDGAIKLLRAHAAAKQASVSSSGGNGNGTSAEAEAAAARPFFVGLGFHKPHMPFYYPSEMHDLYPAATDYESLPPPAHPMPPVDMPLVAWHEGNFNNKWGQACPLNGSGSDQYTTVGAFRRAYYTSVSYTDSNVGKVMAALDTLGLANDTIVALMGDHGWQLGEMNLWRKMTNFELGVRVPLIIADPSKTAAHGVKTTALAEAVDLFRTFADLAGLPSPGPSVEGDPSTAPQGDSLAPLFAAPPRNGTGPIKKYAFSQFAKRYAHSSELGKQVLWDECTKCKRTDIVAMGFSLRSDAWRYTEWAQWDQQAWKPKWESVNVTTTELYDHAGDYGADFDAATPTRNVAAAPEHAGLVAELSKALRAHFNSDGSSSSAAARK